MILDTLSRCGASRHPLSGPPLEQSWCEVNETALSENIRAIRASLDPMVKVAPAVKSNGYGHGLLQAAHAFVRGGASVLCVHTLGEAQALREGEIQTPIYLFGPLLPSQIDEAIHLELDLVVYSRDLIDTLYDLAQVKPDAVSRVGLHLKIETGNHRQGVSLAEAIELTQLIKERPPLRLVGVTSHFANIEDTRDHRFAEDQFKRLNEVATEVERYWGNPLARHIANSAATLLWPERTRHLARVGIASYGLWPSVQVREECAHLLQPSLRPALSWRARIAQVKHVREGSPIGYGCTYITTRPTQIAVLPVGYFEGYDRRLSNRGHVLIHGQCAPIRGRICMNMCMVDVTEIEGVRRGDLATLLGKDGEAEVSADLIASWCESISYEVISRIAAHIPRYSISE